MSKNLGRGQRLESVIKDYQEKRPGNLQDQLHKISSFEYTNESIERFCDELANKEAESSYNAMLSKRIDHIPSKSLKRMNYHPSSIVETESEFNGISLEEFPPLDLKASKNREGRRSATFYTNDVAKDSSDKSIANENFLPTLTTPNSTEEGAVYTSQSPQKPIATCWGMGRGQRLKMVSQSISQPRESVALNIARACGSEYTNQSIEEFVKELVEKNENME